MNLRMIFKKMTIEQLINVWKSNKKRRPTIQKAKVFHCLLDEFADRNYEAFDLWMLSGDNDPKNYFLKKELI